MKPRRPLIGALLLCAARALAADATVITIPSISGRLTVDGKPDEPVWQAARVLPLASAEFGAPFPVGGETRVATRGAYLCFSARIPEPDRVVAHSTGHNPNWWSEDLVTWNIRVQDTAVRRHLSLSLTVNAVGAYRLQGAAGVPSLEGAESLLVATHLGAGEWTVEAAIPLDRLGQIGFIDVQRVRAPRPDAPELRWYWPAANERATFQLAAPVRAPAPEFHPAEQRQAHSPGAPAAPDLASIPKNVWTETQRDQLQVSRMLENSRRSRMSAIASKEKRDWQKVDSREAWETGLAKYKTPSDYIVSTYRGLTLPVDAAHAPLAPFDLLGQRTWTPGSPAGWPDRSADWDGASALLRRIQWANVLGDRLGNRRDALQLAPELLGANLTEATRSAVAHAATAAQAVTLLVAAPEFMRR